MNNLEIISIIILGSFFHEFIHLFNYTYSLSIFLMADTS